MSATMQSRLLRLLRAFFLALGMALPLSAVLGLPEEPLRLALFCLPFPVLHAGLARRPRRQGLVYPLALAVMLGCLFAARGMLPALIDAAASLPWDAEGLSPYAFPLMPILCVALSCLSLSLAEGQAPIAPALVCGLASLAPGALAGRALPAPLLFPLLAGIALCAAREDAPLFRSLPLAALVLAGAALLVPFAGMQSPALSAAREGLEKAVRERLFYTEARLPFSLYSLGWQPLGPERLGGPANPGALPLLSVKVSGPALLRGTAHGVYTGQGFTDEAPGQRYLLSDPRYAALRDRLFDRHLPAARLMALLPAEEPIEVTLLSDGVSTLWLTQRFSGLSGEDLVPYHAETSEIFATRALAEGDSYAFLGRRMTGDTPGIAAIVQQAAASAQGEAADSLYLSLPEGIKPGVLRLAEEATAGAASDFERAFRLCAWLRETYPYTLSQSVPPEERDFVSWFLLTERKGYCTSFAAAMTVMARLLSLPARYIEGFSVIPSDGLATVTSAQGHAWCEVYFPGFGWLPFDPTPAGHGTDAMPPEAAIALPQIITVTPEPEAQPSDAPQSAEQSIPLPGETPLPMEHRTFPVALIMCLVLLALALLVLLLWLRHPLLRARRRPPREAIDILTTALLRKLQRRGYPRQPGETDAQALRRIGAALGQPKTYTHLAETLNRARYSTKPVKRAQVRLFEEAVRKIPHPPSLRDGG